MAKLLQQLHVVHSSQSQSQELRCELCGGDHSNGHGAYSNTSSEEKVFYMEEHEKQGSFQKHQLLDPSSQERMSKMEDTTEKFGNTIWATCTRVDGTQREM